MTYRVRFHVYKYDLATEERAEVATSPVFEFEIPEGLNFEQGTGNGIAFMVLRTPEPEKQP